MHKRHIKISLCLLCLFVANRLKSLSRRGRCCELPVAVQLRVISRRRSGTSSSRKLLSSQYPLPVPFHLRERRFGQSNRGEESLASCTFSYSPVLSLTTSLRFLKRRRSAPAVPTSPLPSRNKLAGSGTSGVSLAGAKPPRRHWLISEKVVPFRP